MDRIHRSVMLSLILPIVWLFSLRIESAVVFQIDDPGAMIFLLKERPSSDTKNQVTKQDLYAQAVQHLDERRWEKAVELFAEIVRQKDPKTDGALYWKAFALNKLGQRLEALSALDLLSATFPDSRWRQDAKALEMEVRQAAGQTPVPENESDEDLKLMAINSLLGSDPERAVPLLTKVLQSNQPVKAKERALFVLVQSGSSQAVELVTQIARGKMNPELQRKAIQNLGLFGGKQKSDLLSEIYTSSTDLEIKRTVLRSYMTSGDRARLVMLAETEKLPELRQEAIQQLGILNSREELRRLYRSEPTIDIKEKILHAMFIAGDVEPIAEAARSEKDSQLRQKAIHNLGLINARKTSALLLSIYQTDPDPSIRQAVIKSLFLQGDAQVLIDLARKETDPQMKKQIVHRLSLMKSKEAADYLMEILNK